MSHWATGLAHWGEGLSNGHLGDLNEPMLLDALTAVEMALRIDNVPHGRGGVEAAMGFLST
jgi:alanine-glyoxylate transaminase / serine-glyoxylate transaminase / serine-pyruvate transaminase